MPTATRLLRYTACINDAKIILHVRIKLTKQHRLLKFTDSRVRLFFAYATYTMAWMHLILYCHTFYIRNVYRQITNTGNDMKLSIFLISFKNKVY